MASDRTMLPIQSILNHPPSRTRTPFSQQSGSEMSSPTSEMDELARPGHDDHMGGKPKKSRDCSDLTYTKPQGTIKFPPFENLDPATERLVLDFQVFPFGEIGQYCAHIPYSSDKKDVFEKTGRESFHVFVYRFTDPGDGRPYEVMWDYLGGFVRISPFFKSRKHKKTGPAKMLDLNKGLRDVTFHMTGGNRVAQGYWIPYRCARAVCTTFCHPIAGALIPIFGPTFPQDCVRPDSARYGRMVIEEELIREAKHEITAYRHSSLSLGQKPPAVTSHPRQRFQPFEHSRQKSEQSLSVRPLRTLDPYRYPIQGTTQYPRPVSSMSWTDPGEPASYGNSLSDHVPWVHSYQAVTRLELHQQHDPRNLPTADLFTKQVETETPGHKRGRGEEEPRYRLRGSEQRGTYKKLKLDDQIAHQTGSVVFLSQNYEKPTHHNLPARGADSLQTGNPMSHLQREVVELEPPKNPVVDPRLDQYGVEELEAAAVLMGIHAWQYNTGEDSRMGQDCFRPKSV